ncbi:MAG: hypothetical protein WD651_00685 [Acidimicrobiia bacterium]
MNRGPRFVLIALGVAVGIVVLYFLFEWAGDFLDSGGAIGA